MSVLAGDIGGTNARLALFPAGAPQAALGEPIFEEIYPSASRSSLDVIIEEFLATAATKLGAETARVTHACLGIAGPIENNICRATNLPWVVDGRALSQRLGIPRVTLVNDFFAAALGVTAVGADQLAPLGGGPPVPRGPIAVLGAGTGLGQAFLLWSPVEDGYQVVSSEGGHVDLAARTPLEFGLVQFLTNKYGRVSCERVLSGQGLVDAFTFLSEEPACRGAHSPRDGFGAGGSRAGARPGGGHLAAGHGGHRSGLRDGAVDLLLGAGRDGGQPRPMLLATGGVYVAGGIAPRILSYLRKGAFREAFDRKGRLHTLVEKLPAYVVTHPQPGLLGAAKVAMGR